MKTALDVVLMQRLSPLSPTERHVLTHVAVRASGEAGVCSASQSRLADDTGYTTKCIGQTIASLVERGVLVVEREPEPRTRTPGVYRVVYAAIGGTPEGRSRDLRNDVREGSGTSFSELPNDVLDPPERRSHDQRSDQIPGSEGGRGPPPDPRSALEVLAGDASADALEREAAAGVQRLVDDNRAPPTSWHGTAGLKLEHARLRSARELAVRCRAESPPITPGELRQAFVDELAAGRRYFPRLGELVGYVRSRRHAERESSDGEQLDLPEPAPSSPLELELNALYGEREQLVARSEPTAPVDRQIEQVLNRLSELQPEPTG